MGHAHGLATWMTAEEEGQKEGEKEEEKEEISSLRIRKSGVSTQAERTLRQMWLDFAQEVFRVFRIAHEGPGFG